MQGLEESAQNRYPMVWFGLLVTCFGAFGVFDPCCWVQTNPVTVLGELHLNFDGFFGLVVKQEAICGFGRIGHVLVKLFLKMIFCGELL